MVVTAETMAVTIDMVHSDNGAGSDRGAWPAGRMEAPRGCGALALAATRTAAEATTGENVDGAGASLGVLSVVCGGVKPREA